MRIRQQLLCERGRSLRRKIFLFNYIAGKLLDKRPSETVLRVSSRISAPAVEYDYTVLKCFLKAVVAVARFVKAQTLH